MSMARELAKYSKQPSLILPRLKRMVLSPLGSRFARAWVRLAGRERLRKGKNIFIFGAFGGRRYGDNSAVFFEYMASSYPGIDCYWVMREDAYREREKKGNFPPLPGRFLFKDRFRTHLMTLIADAHIYSHGRYDVTDYPKNRLAGVIDVMLNHGLTALKRKAPGPAQPVSVNAAKADLLIASSAGEARIKNEEWGIPREKIVITGQPRDDRLLSGRGEILANGKTILYMPTWRSWNAREFSLRKSDFYRQIKAFLEDSGLSEYLVEKGICLQLYVHMWMREFFEEFKRDFSMQGIEILAQDNDLQTTILESSLLITDYSSICWDFLLLDKPVLFYQFDRDEYIRHTGSYIDLEKDLFGPVALTAGEAASWTKRFVESGFSATPFRGEMNRMKEFAFAFQDGKNCERLARAILERCPAKNLQPTE